MEGDEVLITVRGTLGGIVAVDSKYKGWNVSREVAVIPLINEYDSKCLAYFLGSPVLQSWFSRNTKGVAYTGINIETLKSAPIPILSLSEQKEIVRIVEEKLSAADRLMTEIDTKLTQAQQQKQTILASAFKGELVNAT